MTRPAVPTRWWRRLPTLIEIGLVLVLAVSVSRLAAYSWSNPNPGAVDIGFSEDMAAHHEQAVLMANLAQTRGGPAVAALANAILINQSEEIGLLRGWLQLWQQPTTDPTPMSWVAGRSMSQMSMPGMATPDQLNRLAGLRGRPFDVLFLQLMIRHHEGGLEMCRYAQGETRLDVVRRAAVAMSIEQIEDIAQMQALLRADGAKALP